MRDPWPRMPHPDVLGYGRADYGNRIPQIAVEVFGGSGEVEDLIRGVDMIPGSTEWGYMPEPVKRLYYDSSGEIVAEATENSHRFPTVSDWSVSLDVLQGTLRNVETVALVVTWFGDDLRAGAMHHQAEGRE